MVEDETAVRQVMVEALRSVGYTVLETGDAEEGLRICASHPGPIHLLMSDVIMPKMNGWSLARQACEKRADLKVLYMSGYTDSAVVQRAILERGIAFLQKPFTPAALARKVREVLDEGGAVTAAGHRKRSAG